MYDQQTASLIRDIPAIDGVVSGRLPEFLTETFAEIAALRLRANQRVPSLTSEAGQKMGQLRLLADVLEIHAATAVERTNRDAAAYVSATAHQLLFQIKELREGGPSELLSISADSISSRISAALLFLAAGYPADAAEVLRSVILPKGSDVRDVLVRAVASFCAGDMPGVINQGRPTDWQGTDGIVQAELILWERVLSALRIIAARFVLGASAENQTASDPLGLLESVKRDAVAPISLPPDLQFFSDIYSTFAGPHHLATLLVAATQGTDGRGLIDAPFPQGPPPDDWLSFLRRRARVRPFLWTNHMDALRAGLLNVGKSAAISFPTGAGKSTLAELKIASTILSGKKVVYLAPTLALVGQVTRNLKDLLPQRKVKGADIDDQLFSLLDTPLGDDVLVMTPERCLLLVTVFPETFEEIGLVVFDECHAMHMASEHANQRGVDAMLCLLKVLNVAANADVLLMSALMSNGEELAGWLRTAYGKDVLLFDAAWKPTRQARGSIIFPSTEISSLIQLARSSKGNLPQRRMLAHPYCLICLEQTWQTNRADDYRILALSDEAVRLRAERDSQARIQIKSDTSGLAIDIALRAASQGLKSIVFFHNQLSVPASVRKAEELSHSGDLELNERERQLFESIASELGGSEYVYLPNAIAGGHHGQLLPYERELAESAFARSDGIKVLFSTNTLAQGMNLPADQVIIVRTGAYNAETEQYDDIEVHDLLNAAGRAGRAGHAATGLVLVIPDQIVTFDPGRQRVSGTTITDLKNDVLSQDDRCLRIGDPIDVLLDRCVLAPTADDDLLNSLALRLPSPQAEERYDETVRRFFSRSLAAYKASLNGQANAFDEKILKIARWRQQIIGEGIDRDTDAICSATGLSPQIAASLISRIGQITSAGEMSVGSWVEWLLDWFDDQEEARAALLRSEDLTSEQLRECFKLWLEGAPFLDIELSAGTPERQLKNLRKARRFAKNTVRSVSYSVGLVAQVVQSAGHPERVTLEAAASTAAILIREGVDTVEKLILLQYSHEKFWTRVKVNQEAEAWLSEVQAPVSATESPAELRRRIIRGIRRYAEKESGIS